MTDVKETLKKELRVEQDVKKYVLEIKNIFKSDEPEDVKLESVNAILTDLSEQIVEAKVDAMFEHRTKLLSASAADEFLAREFDYAGRTGMVFSVILMDLDHLKYINDEFGHVTGTKIIMDVARAIKKAIRRSDVAARYGGDEFLVILRSSGACRHEQVIERIKKSVEKIDIEGVKVSLSVGAVCSSEEKFINPEAILKSADQKLYKEKENRINVNL